MNESDDATNPDKKALATRLKGLREKFSWTLSELSQTTAQVDPMGDGISKVSISRYENGDSYPGYRELKLIAQAFGVSISYLFYGESPDPYGSKGGEISLDAYLRNVIKEVLIEEGLIAGESKSDRDRKRRQAQLAISSRLHPISTDQFDDEDRLEAQRLKAKDLSELEQMVAKDSTSTKKAKTKQK